jgi:hypothetical protein
MLVTLTSRGAAVERIELADERFHDQDDWSGYLGHLAPEAVAEGCRIGVVGQGTPAALAGLKPDDVIVRIGDLATPDPRTLATVLAATRPRQSVTIELLREGRTEKSTATLGRRPLEVVRPEYKAAPVGDPDRDPHDPLSFRLSLESRDGRKRREPLVELAGNELADVDWETEPTDDGQAVRFSRTLPRGLKVVKEYRLAAPTDDPATPSGYRLELTLELQADDGETVVAYALDGPTGLPTEGWWYAQRVARDWGSLAVRDATLRFVGEPSTLVSGLKIADGALEHPA